MNPPVPSPVNRPGEMQEHTLGTTHTLCSLMQSRSFVFRLCGGGGGEAACRRAGDPSAYGIFPSRKRSPSAGSHEMIVNGVELGKHIYLL